MAKGDMKVWQVLDENGKIIRLVEAQKVKQVKEFLVGKVTIEKASALTVARAGLEVERA